MDTERLLIVDDDPALLRALTRALQLRTPRVQVETCDSGAAALSRLAAADFDAVITDIKMPGMDGLTLLSKIRDQFPELPTLLITGHGQHDLAVQALRGGAFDFIQKPVDRDYLLASVSRAFRVRSLARQVSAQRLQLERHAAQLEQTVEERTRELQDSNQAKDRFLAMLGHELRNPLAAMQSALEVINLAGEDDATREEAREVIDAQVRHMVRLLDDLLDVSRITRDRITLQRRVLNFVDLVENSIKTVEPAIRARQQTCAAEFPDSGLPVHGDSTRLQQIVTNLLGNATKYTEPGGEIHVTVESDGNQAVLRVRDNGIGIEPDMLPRVFEPFAQAECSLDRSQGGLGIGLTLAHKLVDLHGGSVAAASEGAGRGSEFTVRLPLATESSCVQPDPEPEPQSDGDAHPLRILLIEDNQTLANMTGKLLTQCGHEVVETVHDGLVALEVAACCAADVILLDVGLPGMDGYEVARRLRQQPELDDVLLVALTGYGQQEDRRRSREAGFDYHLVKPVSVQALQGVLCRHDRTLNSRLS